jgi:sugar phosphate isomerase/epimerase
VSKRQFSLAHLTALSLSPPELVYMAATTGYDFVSIRPIHLGLPNEPNYDLAKNKQMLADTKQALNETGVGLLDIELAKVADGIDPTVYEPAFEVAAELGGRHVLSSIWTNDRQFAREGFAKICELAKPYGLTVELEFVPIAAVSNLKQAVDVLRDTGCENAGLLIDAHHFHRALVKIEDLEGLPREWFHYFHLCDAGKHIPNNREELTRIMREERLYVGEGGIPLQDILKRLPNMPYSLEIPHMRRAKEIGYETHVRQCLESAKAYLNKYVHLGY